MTELGRRFRLALLGGLCALCLLVVCCRRQSVPLATLEQAKGAADRDHRDGQGRWEKATPGATFFVGDALRTGLESQALLRLFDRSALALKEKTLIRFLDRASAPRGTALDVEMGEATLEAGEAALEVGLDIGVARVDAHGKLRLTAHDSGTRVEVMIGSARILEGGRALELRPGDVAELTPGKPPAISVKASERPLPEAQALPSAAASAAPSQDVPDAAPTSSADAPRPRLPGPSFVDLVVAAGDSFVIHDPRPPTAIGFVIPGCANTAVLTLEGGKGPRETIGSSRVSAEVSAGSYPYTVSCLDGGASSGKPIARGKINVVADSGVRKLARTAAATNVDTDGRRYTVLYQTLLPKLSVRWPNAPAAATYELSVSSKRGTRTYSSPTPSYSFASGSIPEGELALTFSADGRRSRETAVSIRFDNAAPTASLSSPADASFAPGSSVLVAGSALPGWTVAVAGRELAQDDQNRFSELVSAPASERALAIRFSQAGRGVHYYLRRSAR